MQVTKATAPTSPRPAAERETQPSAAPGADFAALLALGTLAVPAQQPQPQPKAKGEAPADDHAGDATVAAQPAAVLAQAAPTLPGAPAVPAAPPAPAADPSATPTTAAPAATTASAGLSASPLFTAALGVATPTVPAVASAATAMNYSTL